LLGLLGKQKVCLGSLFCGLHNSQEGFHVYLSAPLRLEVFITFVSAAGDYVKLLFINSTCARNPRDLMTASVVVNTLVVNPEMLA
jgi:hypothetical protein